MMKLDIQLFADGKVIIEAEIDTSGIEEGIDDIEGKLESSKLSGVVETLTSKLKTKGKQAIEGLVAGATKLSKGFISILGTIGKAVTIIGIGAGAIVAVLGVILAIGKAVSMLLSENEEIATNLQYIWFVAKTMLDNIGRALGNLIKPIVEWLIKALFIILGVLGTILNILFGIDVFKGTGVDNFQKSLASSAKSAKEIKKQLAGFDEMEVLEDNQSQAGGVGGGIGIPTFDTTQLYSYKDIVFQFYDELGQRIKEMDEALANPEAFDKAYGNWGTLMYGVTQLMDGTFSVIHGIIETLAGIWETICGVLTGDWDKAWEGIKRTFRGAFEVIKGIFYLIAGIGNTIWGAIKGVALSVVDAIKSKWETLKAVFSALWTFVKARFIDPMVNGFNNLKDKIVGAITSAKDKAQEKMNNLKDGFKGVINKIIDGINALIRGLNKIKFDVPDWVPVIGGKKWGFDIREIPKLARGGIVNNPGRGVMMGNYIAGENGAEAVLPLTDDTLQKLANMIPITINLTNTMNGRVISRELQKVQNNQDFAYNR